MLIFILLQVFCLSLTQSQGLQNYSSSDMNYIPPLDSEYSGSGSNQNELTFSPTLSNKTTNYTYPTTFKNATAKETATNENKSKFINLTKFLI